MTSDADNPTPQREIRARHHLSIPFDLRARLRAVSRATGIPQTRITERGLRLALAQIEAALATPPST
jgi:hypothetical protein